MRSVIIMFLIFLTFLLKGQPSFNKNFTFEYGALILTSVEMTDSSYISIGLFRDSLPPYRSGNVFAEFDLEGTLLNHKIVKDSLKSFEVWEAPLVSTYDGGWVASGLSIGLDPMRGILIKYTPQGDTVFIRDWINPYYPEEFFIHPLDVIQTRDSGYLSLDNIGVLGPSFNGIALTKFSPTGDMEWQQIYDDDRWERPYELLQDDDGGYLIGSWRTNFNIDNNNFRSQCWIIKTDSVGEIVWEYLSPLGELQTGVRGMVKTPDGGYVIASGWGYERFVNETTGVLLQDGYFFKLDADRNLVWERKFRSTVPAVNDRFTRMITASDSSGYIACGSRQDTATVDGVLDGGFQGWLAKVSPQGDSLWNRLLNIIHSPADIHVLYDIKETPDGGFLMCGEVKDLYAQAGDPVQTGWLIKVDEYGCLVPGCHLVSSLEDPTATFHLSLFPNPTTDYLNIYYEREDPLTKVSFRVIDMQGREMTRFSSPLSAVTHLLPVHNYPVGTYVLQYFEGAEFMRSEKFVVGR